MCREELPALEPELIHIPQEVQDTEETAPRENTNYLDYARGITQLTVTYFTRDGQNWVRQQLTPLFADQTPRGVARIWPIVREFRLWPFDTIPESPSSASSDSDSSEEEYILAFVNQEEILTISDSE